LEPDHWSGCARTLYKDSARWTESVGNAPPGLSCCRARAPSPRAQCPATTTRVGPVGAGRGSCPGGGATPTHTSRPTPAAGHRHV